MTYTFIAGRCGDLPVAVCCRVMKVSTSGFYAWRTQPCSDRDWDDALLTNTIVEIHRMSRRSYGSPRVHAELRLGLGTCCSRKRVERLMRQAGVAGSTVGDEAAAHAAMAASPPTISSTASSIPPNRTACG